VGRLVLERYYLDLVRSLPPGSEETPLPPVIETQPPAFDFNLEMHQTRVTVDQLLAEGMIEEAESYMEERRRLFVENGYAIRKLNQAYFAFYGGYQSGTPGVGGEDPIGPAVHDIRQRSPSLYDFVVNVRSVTSREALLILQEHLSGDE
jgi:hypothetical protein